MRSYLVIAALGTTVAGCGITPDLPRHFSIDDRFADDEQAQIRAAAEAWNVVGREYFGSDQILICDGTIGVPDGFNISDFADDRHVAYLGINDANYQMLTSSLGPYACGEGTLEDIVLFTFYMHYDGQTREEYLNFLRMLATHELGHFLGLLHVMDDGQAVMAPSTVMREQGDHPNTLDTRDIQDFCRFHHCLKEP
jgi:hypothetical protein